MVLENVIYSCEKCGAEFEDEIDAEDCEGQAVPKSLPRGTVFVEELPKGFAYLILTGERDVLEREHLRTYHADIVEVYEKGKIYSSFGAAIVNRDNNTLDSPWQSKILELSEVAKIYQENSCFRKLYDELMEHP